jgi:pentatricopeptide repeat protein
MSLWLAKTVLRDNWHLVALIAGLLVVGFFMKFSGAGAPASSEETAAQTVHAAALPDQTPERATPQSRAKEIIAKHKARFDANPSDPDAAPLLNAMGNLYRQKLADYPNAIQCYELLLHDYPNWDGIRTTLLSLADCYTRQGDTEGANRVYQEIMKRYPPDTQEHQYAKAQTERSQ